jgi:hypothetical protein
MVACLQSLLPEFSQKAGSPQSGGWSKYYCFLPEPIF